jgi:hypothetical protein
MKVRSFRARKCSGDCLQRDENDAGASVHPMSLTQIIDELQKLTPAGLLAVRRKLIEISRENEGVSLCDAAALAYPHWQ